MQDLKVTEGSESHWLSLQQFNYSYPVNDRARGPIMSRYGSGVSPCFLYANECLYTTQTIIYRLAKIAEKLAENGEFR